MSAFADSFFKSISVVLSTLAVPISAEDSTTNTIMLSKLLMSPGKIEPQGGASLGPLKKLGRTIGIPYNAAPFSSSGHPALNLPVGFVPAKDDKNVWLPTGLQIVGKKFGDLTILKVAGSWEKAYNWKTMRYSGD
jgi:amidase